MKDRIVKMLDVGEPSDKNCNAVAIAMTAICLIVLTLSLAMLGTMEKSDVDAQIKNYCKDVHEGVFPDYNGSYQSQCKNGEPKQ